MENQKKIPYVKLYFRALRFTWTRIPRAIWGFILYVLVIILGTILMELWPNASGFISKASLIAGLLLSSYVSSKHKKVYNAAMVALITQTLRTGKLPKHAYSDAMEDVRERFESMTMSQLAKGSIKTVFMKTVRKKIRSEIIVERGRSIVSDARAMAVLYGGAMIPYLGQCILAYNFDHIKEPMLKATADGIEVFIRSYKEMIREVIKILIIEGAVLFILGSSLLVPLLKFTLGHEELSSEMMSQVDFGMIAKNEATMAIALALAVAFLFVSACIFIIKPWAYIMILKKYFECCEVRPAEGRVYKMLPKVVKKEAEREVKAHLEVERKWVVDPAKIPYDLSEKPKTHIIQNYVSYDPTTRIRSVNDGEQYILTIKAKGGNKSKFSHEEYEFEIDQKDYYHMVKRVIGYTVDKDRYLFFDETGREIEFDVFHGVHEGLVYYETDFETSDEAASFIPPDFVLKEVTQDRRYNNTSLSKTGKIPDINGEEVAQ